MIIPNDLTLEEYLGVLKAQEATLLVQGNMDEVIKVQGNISMLEVIKREIDRKACHHERSA